MKVLYQPELDKVKGDKLSEIANARFIAETSGVTINGMTIPTDRQSQALITGAALQAIIDNTYVCNWKTENGFIPLDANTILAIASVVRQHVQACFDKEKIYVERINSATDIEDLIDLKWE